MNPVDNQSHTLVLGLHPRTFHVLQDTTQHQQFLHVDRDNRLGRAYTRNRIFFTRPAGSVVSQVRIDLDICGAKGCDELNGGGLGCRRRWLRSARWDTYARRCSGACLAARSTPSRQRCYCDQSRACCIHVDSGGESGAAADDDATCTMAEDTQQSAHVQLRRCVWDQFRFWRIGFRQRGSA